MSTQTKTKADHLAALRALEQAYEYWSGPALKPAPQKPEKPAAKG